MKNKTIIQTNKRADKREKEIASYPVHFLFDFGVALAIRFLFGFEIAVLWILCGIGVETYRIMKGWK